MTSGRTIADFVFRVRSARSPVAKLKVLLQEWSVLRALTPSQRMLIARDLGFEGAEDLVTRIAAEHGTLPPKALMDALTRAGESSPDTMQALLGELRRPEERKSVIHRGLAALESLLVTGSLGVEGDAATGADPADAGRTEAEPVPDEEPMDGPETAAPAGTSDGLSDAPSAASVGRSAETPEDPVAVPPPPPARKREPEPVARPSAPAPPASGGGNVPTAAPSEPVAAPAPSPPPGPAPLPGPIPSPRGGAPRRPGQERPRRRAEAAPELVAGELREALVRLTGPLARLRMLRQRSADLRSLDARTLAPIVEAFESEWARRRALLALLDGGAPADSGEAVMMASTLSSRAGRRWYLTTLVSLRSLSVEERRALAERDELGAMMRRRLAAADPVAVRGKLREGVVSGPAGTGRRLATGES